MIPGEDYKKWRFHLTGSLTDTHFTSRVTFRFLTSLLAYRQPQKPSSFLILPPIQFPLPIASPPINKVSARKEYGICCDEFPVPFSFDTKFLCRRIRSGVTQELPSFLQPPPIFFFNKNKNKCNYFYASCVVTDSSLPSTTAAKTGMVFSKDIIDSP